MSISSDIMFKIGLTQQKKRNAMKPTELGFRNSGFLNPENFTAVTKITVQLLTLLCHCT